MNVVPALALGLALVAQGPPAGPQNGPNRSGPGPWDNDVLVHRLDDGGRIEQLFAFNRAGVPTVARMSDGRLISAFQSFPADDDRNFDRVAVRFSSDEGRTWTAPDPIVVEGLEAGLSRPFDPTLVPLPDGRLRLYFTSNRSPSFSASVPMIYSGVSRDGVHYTFEPGVRFGVEGRIVIDCAVALHRGVFHLISPDNGTTEELMAAERERRPPAGGRGYHAVSDDGLTFRRVADVTMPSPQDRFLGNMQSDNGRLVFFGTGPGPWPMTSADGVVWERDRAAARVPGADPGAVRLKSGGWLIISTSPPRPGTPSDRNRPVGRVGAPGL